MKRKATATRTGRRLRAPAGPRVVNTTELMRRLYLFEAIRPMSARERLEQYVRILEAPRWHQAFVDSLLRRVLAGEDPRRVFHLEKQRRGVKRTAPRELAAVHEFARLRAAGAENAAELVAEAFAATPRTLERWCRRWDVGQVNLAEYQAQLRSLGLM